LQGEENVAEALKHCNTALVPHRVPADVAAILADPRATAAPTAATPPFLAVLARAVADSVTAHGALPLRGTLPDMFAAADAYLARQAVYKAKARADAALVAARVAELLAGVGRPAADVTRRFCASCAAAPWRSSTHPGRSTRPPLGCGCVGRLPPRPWSRLLP
jgi:amyloid beta precursor protein binding protein 1